MHKSHRETDEPPCWYLGGSGRQSVSPDWLTKHAHSGWVSLCESVMHAWSDVEFVLASLASYGLYSCRSLIKLDQALALVGILREKCLLTVKTCLQNAD
jgi:hypothetical protein